MLTTSFSSKCGTQNIFTFRSTDVAAKFYHMLKADGEAVDFSVFQSL